MPPYIAPEEGDRVGVWGSPTSTLDWCEENHVLSFYIAEFCEKTNNYYATLYKPNVCVTSRPCPKYSLAPASPHWVWR